MDESILSGSGLVDELYYTLWSKTEQKKPCPHVLLPQTVIFEYSMPETWYFTSVVDGELKRKHRIHISYPSVLEEFEKLGRNSASGIVASFAVTESMSAKAPTTTFQYLDMAGVRELLTRPERPAHGVLQQFIEPSGGRNSMLRVTWTSQVMLIERRSNRYSVSDRSRSVHERAITFEGALHHSDMVPVSGTALPAQIQKVCRTVAEHVRTMSGERVHQVCECPLKGGIFFLCLFAHRSVADGPAFQNGRSRAPLASVLFAAACGVGPLSAAAKPHSAPAPRRAVYASDVADRCGLGTQPRGHGVCVCGCGGGMATDATHAAGRAGG
jgi:hypothetical protein